MESNGSKRKVARQILHGKGGGPTAFAAAPSVLQEGLQDGHGRRFRYLRLSVTDVCNFRCRYCLPDGYRPPPGGVPDDFLGADEIAVIAAAFARLGTSKIRLTGGEPSLRADLPDLIWRCRQTPGIATVAVTTNGYRLPQQVGDWQAAGLSALNVSIDSLSRAEFARITGHDRLPQILRGIERALALGLAVKVNAVLLREGGAARLNAFMDWLRDMPVTLRFIELMPTGDNRVFFQGQHVRGEDWMQTLREQGWQEAPRATDSGPAREFRHPGHAGRIGFILPYSRDFCASCNRLRVSAQGHLHLCLFADEGHDIRRWCRTGDVEGLMQHLQELVGGKAESHYLQRQHTGAIRHFAQIGG